MYFVPLARTFGPFGKALCLDSCQKSPNHGWGSEGGGGREGGEQQGREEWREGGIEEGGIS
jgi:hypothetical protein